MTAVFLVIVVSLRPFALFAQTAASTTTLIALLVALIPTTIGALLSAIGIAGMDRLVRRNVLAMSGRAVEASGDVDVLLLDKTGTITLGNRQATEFLPLPGVQVEELADAAQLSSLSDETPEGRSIVVLAKERYGLRGRELLDRKAEFIAFSAITRMSGADLNGRRIRKGATDAVVAWVTEQGGTVPRPAHRWWRRSPAAAAPRWWSPTAPARWAWCTSRTSSRAASASASTSCDAWASRRS